MTETHIHAESGEEIAAVEELMVPPSSLTRYLAFGWKVLRWTSSMHLLRLVRSTLAFLCSSVPIVAIGVLAWSFEPVATDPSGTVPLDTQFDVPSLVAVLATIVGLALVVALRGCVDSFLFGAYRDAVGGTPRMQRGWLRRTARGFGGIVLLQVALLVGTTMFVAPVGARIIDALSSSPSELSNPVILAVIGSFCGIIVTMRFLTMLVSAYLAWRPDFVAGTIFAALGLPLRDVRTTLALLGTWFVGFGLPAFGIAWFALTGFVQAQGTGIAFGAFEAVIIACLWLLLVLSDHLMDATLVTMVGHRIGMVSTRSVESRRSLAEPAVPYDERIEASGGGFLRAAKAAAEQVPHAVSYASILGYVPVANDREVWTLPSGLEPFRVVDVAWGESGALEVVVTSEDATFPDAKTTRDA